MKYFNIVVALIFAVVSWHIYAEQQKIIENLRVQKELNEVQDVINESQDKLNEVTYRAIEKLYLNK